MKDHLERLIQTVQETQLVERLMSADSLEERVKICEEARSTPEFTAFKKHYDAIATMELDIETESVITGFACTSDEAVAVAMILIIDCIDETDMFDSNSYFDFINSLRLVQGEQAEVANAVTDFLGTLEHKTTDLPLEVWLEEIF